MFRWKEDIYEIYKESSISKAAQNLYISQPSLSAKLKNVEQRIGALIFDRSTCPLRLTEAGNAYIKAVEEIFRIENRFENYINDLKMLKLGRLSIGASNVFAAFALPVMITEFNKRYPDVKINLVEGNTATLEAMLAENALDMVIDNNRYDSELYDRELYSEEFILLVLPKSNPAYASTREFQLTKEDLLSKEYRSDVFRTVPLSELKDAPFVMLTPSNDTRIRGEKLCRDAGFRPQIMLELNQQSTAYMVASTRMGATFVSDTIIEKLPNFDNLAYYKLAGEEAKRKVYFYYKKHKLKSRAMEEFIKLIKEHH